MSAPPPLRHPSPHLSMASASQNSEKSSRPGEGERSSKSIQTSCAGTEPYYRVPILQKVISPAPGYSSALYSVQVMTQSEVDTMKSNQRSSYQVLTPSSYLEDVNMDSNPENFPHLSHHQVLQNYIPSTYF